MADEDQGQPGGAMPAAQAGSGAVSAAEAALSAAKAAQAAGVPAPVDRATPSAFTVPAVAQPGDERAPEGIALLGDVALNVKIELGRTRMLVEDVLRLGDGSVVELDKLAGDPVDVYVNDRPVARGEVLVLNDNFCVRINEILSPPGAEAA